MELMEIHGPWLEELDTFCFGCMKIELNPDFLPRCGECNHVQPITWKYWSCEECTHDI